MDSEQTRQTHNMKTKLNEITLILKVYSSMLSSMIIIFDSCTISFVSMIHKM